MAEIIPTIGRIVIYKLSQDDCNKINKRRADGDAWAAFHRQNSNGAMVHVGNYVAEGYEYPALVVKTWGNSPTSAVNLKVELDGSDSYWATSRIVGNKPGDYHWMEYQKGQAAKTEALEAKLAK
jgi:hypothetical protein